MDTLRKQLGEHVRVTREADGYRSRDTFAAAANIGVRSVAAVERGEQAGRKVLTAIERALRWPTGSITAYLEGNADLPAVPAPQPSTIARHEWSADERRKILAMPLDDVIAFGQQIKRTSSERAAVLWLNEAMRLKAEAAAIEPEEAPRRSAGAP
jgi:hypothetical protein